MPYSSTDSAVNKFSVSVAMCTYNGARFLREQLDSIARQTQQPDELVVSDDCSSDETPGIIKSFASQAGFSVRVLSNSTRLGPAKNFEQAIDACRGDIIIFSDQDDVWNPHKVRAFTRVFNEHPKAVYAFSDAVMVDQFGKPLNQTFWEAVRLKRRLGEFSGPGQVEVLLKYNLIPGAAMAFRSAFRQVVLPIPAGWMHDYWIALLGSVLAQGVPINDTLFNYRRHPDQVCGWRKITFTQSCKDSLNCGAEDSLKKCEIFGQVRSRVLATGDLNETARARVQLLQEKELHLSKRAGFRSASRTVRIAGVFAEAWSGRYQRFSDSWYSVVRDL